MATCQDIIDRALRLLGVIGAGEAASGHAAADGLRSLQDIICDLPLLLDGAWREVVLSATTLIEARDGDRIHTRGFDAAIALPPAPETRDGGRVHIIGAEHGQAGVWVFAASRGLWSRIDDLEIHDDSPFGAEDDAGLAAILAVSLTDDFGADVSDATSGRAARAIGAFRARFYRPVEVGCGAEWLAMSQMGRTGEEAYR